MPRMPSSQRSGRAWPGLTFPVRRKTTILVSGRPGSGKTTVIKRVLEQLPGTCGGFFTEEIREAGQRLGFALVTLHGQRATLAHVQTKSRYRVGKYGVDLQALERVGVPAVSEAARSSDCVVIDEIGKMELFSEEFRKAVLEAIERGKPVLGTIMSAPHPWADAIKAHSAVMLLPINEDNRGSLPSAILEALQILRSGR